MCVCFFFLSPIIYLVLLTTGIQINDENYRKFIIAIFNQMIDDVI